MSVASPHMFGYVRTALAGAVVLVVASALLVIGPAPADAVGAEGEGWPSFNESPGCGSPWMRGPNVERSGSLSSSTILRGPHADYFGRTVGQVWDSLFWWDVPMSNDESVRLHKLMRPALDAVEANLARAASDGYLYRIIDRYTFAYTARTVGGAYRVSQHTFGNAIDINSTTNPYTTGPLKSDMPPWFRQAWQDAGYCWGGDWISIKDAMHYNWRGPLFTPGVTTLSPEYPPMTSREPFTRVMHNGTVGGSLSTTVHRLLMDGDNDGAIDVVNVSATGSGPIVDILQARHGFRGCSVERFAIPYLAPGDTAINGDWNRDGAQDLWVIDDTNGLDITVYLRTHDFAKVETLEVSAPPADAYLSADHDVDGWGDLYLLRRTGSGWDVEVLDGRSRFAETLATGTIPAGADVHFTAVDRNDDQIPDLVAIGPSGSLIADGASGFASREAVGGVPGTPHDVAGSDFDGDGRHDLVALTGNKLVVYAGNSRIPGVQVTSWFEFPAYDCSATANPYPYEGTFRDDDLSVHRHDIDGIAALDITLGCNPPLRDRFCPQRTITRGELAAFLKRALLLPAATTDAYVDDGESMFEEDINRLAQAGIRVACNGAGDRFCPDDLVTRDVMAQFLVAAFSVPPSSVNAFVDDDGMKHEADINAIAAVSVTRGCNPPSNDRFCPNRLVSRAEMASFMVRAIGWIGQ